jgi:hypothetical protein
MIIKNKYIPFKGFAAMAVWPFIFVKKDVSEKTINHEKIHHAQQREVFFWLLLACLVFKTDWYFFVLSYFVYYALYVLIWLWHLAVNTHFENPKDAYRRICFEREAYGGQEYTMYLKVRKSFAWLKHILKKD